MRTTPKPTMGTIALVLSIPLFVAACGGGGSAGMSNTGMTEAGSTPNHPGIRWLLDTSDLRLNKGASTDNVVLDALPDNSAVQDQLKAEGEKTRPNANFYYNFSTIFGKYEGNSNYPPGEWTLESDCSETGRCTLISDTEDDYHIATKSSISRYFIGTVPWDRDGDPNNVQDCDGSNAATCERKTSSDVVIRPSVSGDGVDSEPIMTANGIAMIQARGTARTASSNAPYDFLSYGAWMDHSGFFAEAYLYDLQTGRSQENAAWTLGITTGSNPAPQSGQTMTWEGVIVGMAGTQAVRQASDPYIERDFEPVQGDATVTVSNNGGNLEIGVAFTDIFHLNPEATDPIANITWNHPQISSDTNGRFTSAEHNLKAAFYGPNHEEVAGTYEKVDGNDFLVGSFGARKQ